MGKSMPIQRQYTGPTPNPELDAARHDADCEAHDELMQKAAKEAPGIMLKWLQALKKPGDWFDSNKFPCGHSAESILQGAFDDSYDDVADRYAELMIEALPYAKEKLLQAMSAWFCKYWAYEVYTEWLEDQQ